ncbi:hypothetical protein RKD37_007632 [Streptomyces ambofaciens]
MDAELFPRTRAETAPGAVHVPDWLAPRRQRELLAACRAWARPPAALRTVHTPGGGTMTARQVCLGRHWYPYGYAPTASTETAPRSSPSRPGSTAWPAAR